MAGETAGGQSGLSSGLGYYGAFSSLLGGIQSASQSRFQSRFAARQTTFNNEIGLAQTNLANRSAMAQYTAQRGQAMAAYTVAVAQAGAENTMREARNQIGNAQADLGNFATALNNNRLLEAAGVNYETAVINRDRMREQLTDQSIEGKIAAAEVRGAYAATTAMAGVDGSSVDSITQAMELKDQRRSFYQERNAGYAEYDTMQQIIGIVPQAMQNFDTSVALPNVDRSLTVAPLPPVDYGPPTPGVHFNQNPAQVWGNTGTDILAWFMDGNNAAASRQMAAAISSWFDTKGSTQGTWDKIGIGGKE